jgi:hypothetical protein
MLFKGIIEKILDDYTVKVRIPFLHKISSALNYTLTEDLPNSQICTLPNTRPNIRVGDVVIVGFENNDLSRPLILGHLFSDNESTTACSPVFNSMEVRYDTILGSNTSIGDITPQQLQCLLGVKENIQQQLNIIKTDLSLMQEEINRLKSLS